MTTDTLGGVWTYCMELCAALAPYDVKITLATMGRALSTNQRWQVEQLHNVELRESEYRLCWMQASAADVEQAGEWLLDLEREVQPDIVQLNDLAHGKLPWSTPVVLAAHSCVFSWWGAVFKRVPPTEEWGDYHQLVSQSVANADLVVAPSRAMLDVFLSHYGPARQSTVIYNGRDFPAIPNAAEAGTTTRVQKEKLIFAAGRIWDQAKNIGVLTDVADQVPWPIYAAGEQNDPNGGSNTPAGINCLGFLTSDEVAQWLKRATLYVAPALYEPFGLSILEAARSDCTLVLGDIPSLREVWGDAAIYVDPENPEQIREALVGLTEDPQLCQKMAGRAFERAKRYTSARMAEHYIDWYHYLLKHSSQSSTGPRKSVGNPTSGAGA